VLDDPPLGHDLEGVQFAAPDHLHRDVFAQRLADLLCKRLAECEQHRHRRLWLRGIGDRRLELPKTFRCRINVEQR